MLRTARNASPLRRKLDDALARLAEAEDALDAIRRGAVDGLVITGPEGPRVFTLQGAEEPYRLLTEQMSEGALTLSRDGIVLYSNQAFARLCRLPLDQVIGAELRDFVAPEHRPDFDRLLPPVSRGQNCRGEIRLLTGEGRTVPLSLSAGPLRLETQTLVCVVATDLSERQRMDDERREMWQRLVRAQEEERRRIALELHDQWGQELTCLTLGLKALEEPVAADRAARQALRRLRGITDRLMRQSHDLARNLHPGGLEKLGLAVALRHHVAGWSERSGVPATFDCLGMDGLRLAPLVETMFYRVAQESLTNVLRHARAARVQVLLHHRNREVLLVVEDDGRGFDVDAARSGGGRHRLGLLGMAERMAMAGGVLQVESARGRGTTVMARAPASLRQSKQALTRRKRRKTPRT
jgi:PAS domain S-box-containing protein